MNAWMGGGDDDNEKLEVDPKLLVHGCHGQISRIQGQKLVFKRRHNVKRYEFSQDMLGLNACGTTKVDSQFKVQEQSPGLRLTIRMQ